MAKVKKEEDVALADVAALSDESFWDSDGGMLDITAAPEEEIMRGLSDPDKDFPPVAPKEKAPAKTTPASEESPTEEEEEEDFSFEDNPGEKPASDPKPKETTEPGNDPVDPEKEEDVKFFTTLAKVLQEKGVFQNVEIKEDDQIDGEKLVELNDMEIESRVEETFQSFFEEMDEDGIAFLKFKKAGGDTRVFLNAYAQSMELPTSDLTTEDGQEKMLRYYYKHIENLDDEDVDDRIEWAKDGKKLEKLATKYADTVSRIEQQKRDALLQQAQEAEERAKENRKVFKETLEETLATVKEVNDVPFTKEDKGLIDYLTKPVVKIGKNKYITGMQADIQKIWQEADRKQLLLLAKFVKGGMKLDVVKQKGAKEKVTEIRKKVFEERDTRTVRSGGTKGKGLADYF